MENANPIADLDALKSKIGESGSGIHLIKPKLIFKLVEDRFRHPVEMNLHIPSSGIGSLTMLEAAVLTSLIRLVAPVNLFEFGTFLGYSTAIMATNSLPESRVYSIDLDLPPTHLDFAGSYSDTELRSNHVSNDNYLRFVQSKVGAYYLSKLVDNVKAKVDLIKGDSTQMDTQALGLAGKVEFVFVDGGHEFGIIKSDTQKSEELLGGNGIIIWHDFNSKIHSEVTDFLNDYCRKVSVFHVDNTMIAFSAFGPTFSKLFSQTI